MKFRAITAIAVLLIMLIVTAPATEVNAQYGNVTGRVYRLDEFIGPCGDAVMQNYQAHLWSEVFGQEALKHISVINQLGYYHFSEVSEGPWSLWFYDTHRDRYMPSNPTPWYFTMFPNQNVNLQPIGICP